MPWSRRKEFAVKEAALFPFRVDPFQEGKQTQFWQSYPLFWMCICASPLTCYINVDIVQVRLLRTTALANKTGFTASPKGEWIHLVDSLPFFKGHNPCDFLFSSSENGSTLEGKYWLPRGSNYFLLQYMFSGGGENKHDQIAFLKSVFIPLKYI